MKSGMGKKRFTNADLLDQFRDYNRLPFLEILADLMQGAPTPEAIADFAEQHPDRWASALKTVAHLGGFHDKLEVTHNLNLHISNLGDAQLEELLQEKLLELEGVKKGPPTLDGKALVVEVLEEKEAMHPLPELPPDGDDSAQDTSQHTSDLPQA